nr:MAK10-like protein [Tanacetum cinerariifolium]
MLVQTKRTLLVQFLMVAVVRRWWLMADEDDNDGEVEGDGGMEMAADVVATDEDGGWEMVTAVMTTVVGGDSDGGHGDGDENPIRTLEDYSRPSHEGYRNTIELPEGNNMVPLRSDTIRLDPSPRGRILLLVSLLNSFHQKGLQNSAMTSLCSNNIKESLFLNNGLVLRTYSIKSLIMALIFGSKSKSFMTMSIPPQDEPLTNRPVYCMENPKQAFVDYTSSRIDEAGGKWYTFQPKKNNLGDTHNPSWKDDPQCSTQIHGSIKTISICPKCSGESQTGKPEEEEQDEKDNSKTSIPTLPHHLIHQFHSSPKMSVNSIYFSNRSAWSPRQPT